MAKNWTSRYSEEHFIRIYKNISTKFILDYFLYDKFCIQHLHISCMKKKAKNNFEKMENSK